MKGTITIKSEDKTASVYTDDLELFVESDILIPKLKELLEKLK